MEQRLTGWAGDALGPNRSQLVHLGDHLHAKKQSWYSHRGPASKGGGLERQVEIQKTHHALLFLQPPQSQSDHLF